MITSIGPLFKPGTFVDATSNVFLGTTNNLWSEPTNWSYNHIPTSSERARIHHYCVVDITTAVCNDLMLDDYECLIDTSKKVSISGSIIGNISTSKITNKGTITYNGSNDIMSTGGILDCSTYLNTFEYTYSGNQNIKAIDYYNFSITSTGTGIKTFFKDTTINGDFVATGNPNFTLALNTYNLTIVGTTNFGYYGKISKTTSGRIIFNGYVASAGNSNISVSGLVFEFRAGAFFGNPITFGTGTIVEITTNNQTLNCNNTIQVTMDNLLIKGNITATLRDTNNGLDYAYGGFNISSTINGDSTNSTINNGTRINYYGTNIMPIGKFLTNNYANNLVIYSGGNQNIRIPDDSNPQYRRLVVQGSGTKTVGGSGTVNVQTGSGGVVTATVSGGFVTGGTVVNGGSNYLYRPIITLSGGGGINGFLNANVSGGAIVSLSVAQQGTGYTSAPSATVTAGTYRNLNGVAVVGTITQNP